MATVNNMLSSKILRPATALHCNRRSFIGFVVTDYLKNRKKRKETLLYTAIKVTAVVAVGFAGFKVVKWQEAKLFPIRGEEHFLRPRRLIRHAKHRNTAKHDSQSRFRETY